MKKNHLYLIGGVAVFLVLVVAVFSRSALFQGSFNLGKFSPALVDCGQISAAKVFKNSKGQHVTRVSTVITSRVPSRVTSRGGTTTVTSRVPSRVTSEVVVPEKLIQKCLPKAIKDEPTRVNEKMEKPDREPTNPRVR